MLLGCSHTATLKYQGQQPAKPFFLAMLLTMTIGCAPAGRGDWQDIDYSSVYRKAGGDNDSGYTAPSSVGCLDDDLYSCR